MKRCIYTKEYFEKADGEHILQNFLGARWTSAEISSNQTQQLFGATIDVALANGLKEIRNLLGTRGGRGEAGPSLKNILNSEGARFTVSPGGKPNIAEPIIKTAQMPNGLHQIQVVLGDMKQIGWAVAKLREMYPNASINIEEIRQQAVPQSAYMDTPLKYSSVLGGDEFFRGALKSVFNLLGAKAASVALLEVFDEVRAFILNGDGDCKGFVHWLDTAEPVMLPKIGDFDHFLAVYSKNGFVDGFIQFYGEIPFLLRLAKNYHGSDFCYGYVVDPFRELATAEERELTFDKEMVNDFESGCSVSNERVWAAMSERFSRILGRYYARTDKQNLSQIVDDVLLPFDGQIITKEMIDELSAKAAEYIARRSLMSRPR